VDRAPAVAVTGRAAALARHESETSAARVERGQVRLPSLWLPGNVGALLDELAERLGSKTAAVVAAVRELAAAEGIEVPEEKT
jgi:hypothetical protein